MKFNCTHQLKKNKFPNKHAEGFSSLQTDYTGEPVKNRVDKQGPNWCDPVRNIVSLGFQTVYIGSEIAGLDWLVLRWLSARHLVFQLVTVHSSKLI